MTDTFEPRTGAAFARAIVGRWIVCNANPQSASVMNAYDGMELTSDGRWFGLESDGAGGLRRATTTRPMTRALRGTYSFYSPARGGLVSGDDTVPSAASMHLHLNEIIQDDYGFEFARAPTRLAMEENGPIAWVRADAEPAPSPDEDEGNACDDATPCAGGLACPPLWTQPGGATEGVCSAPATVALGDGCDPDAVRTCASGLVCLGECLRCATVGGVGAPCDANRGPYPECGTGGAAFCDATDATGAPLHCDKGAGVCATAGGLGAWCSEDDHCDPSLACDFGANQCVAR
jgi:hypothetical protein